MEGAGAGMGVQKRVFLWPADGADAGHKQDSGECAGKGWRWHVHAEEAVMIQACLLLPRSSLQGQCWLVHHISSLFMPDASPPPALPCCLLIHLPAPRLPAARLAAGEPSD